MLSVDVALTVDSRAAVRFAFLCASAMEIGCAGSGSLMLPYASVPARVEVGGFKAFGSVPAPNVDRNIAASPNAGLFHVRVGLHPMQGANSLHDRAFDVGAGYLAESYRPSGLDDFVLHGFHAEGGFFPWAASTEGSSVRLSLIAAAEVMFTGFDSGAKVGPGASLGAYLEWTGTTASAHAEASGGGLGSSAASIGALYGEWAIGVGVTGGYRHLMGRDFVTLAFALSFRLPFGAGLVAVSS